MMHHEERITKIIKLDLKLQCYDQGYWISDAYILLKGTITVENKAARDQPNNVAKKKVILKNCAPFTNCISRINNAQESYAHDFDVVMLMCNLIGYKVNDSKTSGIL